MNFYKTPNYYCSYIKGNLAKSKVFIANSKIDEPMYTQLIQKGYRRSGSISYKPSCDVCNKCIPIRISINQFTPSKTQRRIIKKLNSSLTASSENLLYNDEHYKLYLNYQKKRHPTNKLDTISKENYKKFLLESNVETEIFLFRDHEKNLKMICIFDVLCDGLSSFYTFYDPSELKSSLGTYSILWQIEECKRRNKSFLYLGYWIKQSKKMAYKTKFRPYEVLIDGKWIKRNEL